MRLWLGIGVFLAVIILAFALFVLHITGSPHATETATSPAFAPITAIAISDSYSSKTGVHTVTGSGAVPTPCTTLTATSTVIAAADASSTPTIRVDLTAPFDSGICLQLASTKTFSLSVHADKNATVVVYANGDVASTTPN
jgi:hypothetical protein